MGKLHSRNCDSLVWELREYDFYNFLKVGSCKIHIDVDIHFLLVKMHEWIWGNCCWMVILMLCKTKIIYKKKFRKI